jgi:Ser/Thr protein kinase RdoA (MazF antagonist)
MRTSQLSTKAVSYMNNLLDHSSDFAFQGLTPDIVVNALESVGLYPASGLLALNSYENRVYQFTDDDRKRYVAKFYRPSRWTTEQIQEELSFVEELAQAEVPAVSALELQGQRLHEFDGYRFCVYPSVGGRAFEPNDLDELERLGRQIGRMHAVAKAGRFESRETITYDGFVAQSVVELKQSELLPAELKNAFFAILDPLAERLKSTPLNQFEFQRLHGDCHIGNILQYDDKLTFVDFDDCRSGPAVQDLWMMLSGPKEEQTLQLDALVCGYEDFCDFDTEQVVLIEPLRSFRIIQYMAWLSRRWQDSAFQRAFPWFAESRYWEQQILALKEQLAGLDDAPLNLGFNG